MYRESLLNNRDQIMLSKQLATIHTDLPLLEWDLTALKAQPPTYDGSEGSVSKSWSSSAC